MAEQKKPERQVTKEGEGKRFIVAPEAELEVVKARQKLAITTGVIALLLLLVGGGVAFLLMQKYQQGLAQLPTVQEKPASGLAQTLETQLQPSTNIAQVPQQQETPATGLVQAPPPPPTPFPVQQVQQGIPAQSLLEQPRPPQQFQPMPIQQPTIQPQKPAIPPGLLDYLEQLRRIEMQRKREASNYWIALQALEDLVKALQGVASTGDILNAPEYNPQKTLQTYDAYMQRFMMLRQWLHQLRPPPECQQLHQAYDRALLAHINAIGSLKQRILLKDMAGAALSGLTIQKQIDAALKVADNELASVCHRYGIAKPFDIGDNR
ncbi:hypothetical protein Q2T83_08195 [Fervidibacter sacchari]|uniref:Uncharacterized protein n=1 Tax=Candidatus Fervidibacter sacchari TaxID=1448929 RepID=A0ABT2ESG9_9BACT|nr:hypothetical protein [Candidatus Fervidibacter sacchari]MCS3920886.1 hypothetical protein [Candidatus Fervidibacter sacchari]WKU17786.1 hypothetical protein Q2T83_08195 [Candidatus Fervidibacter sacchari]